MNKVRDELGSDAYLLNTRKIRRPGFAGLFRHPLVEVVAAYDAPPAPAPAPVPTAPVPMPATPSPSLFPPTPLSVSPPPQVPQVPQVHLYPHPPYPPQSPLVPQYAPGPDADKILRMENKLDSISASLGAIVNKIQNQDGDSKDGGLPGSFPFEVERLLLSLRNNEVHEEFIGKIGREVSEVLAREEADPADVMEQIIRQILGEPSPIRLKKYKRTVAVFLGPTGVGKTTTVAKLAAIYAHKHHARVGVITADTSRQAAVEQMRIYAEILQVPLSVVYDMKDMKNTLREHGQCDVVFIDTAGKSPNDKATTAEVQNLIRESEADEAHLVLSATTSFAGCLNILGAYSFLKDFKLLFSKLDETPTYGAMLNVRFLSDSAISFVTDGQNVPDDLAVMDPGVIARRLMGVPAAK